MLSHSIQQFGGGTVNILQHESPYQTYCVCVGGVLLCEASQETHHEEPELQALQTMESRKNHQ